MKDLEALGFGPFFSAQYDLLDHREWVPARITGEGRGGYSVAGCRAPRAELSGRLRDRLAGVARPATGDWVAVADDDDRAVIHEVFDRRTALIRRAAGGGGGQVVAANVDALLIVTAVGRDFNERRLERYLTAVWDSGARPILVINKIDQGDDVAGLVETAEAIGLGVPVLAVSAATGAGVDELAGYIEPGQTVGLIGSSGVGKSSLMNRLFADPSRATGATRDDGKGRHTTTHRELSLLPGGGALIDTPGMRELGLARGAGGIERSFADVAAFAETCRFRDCHHAGEPGCGVAEAIESGELDPARLASYQKQLRELAHAARRRDPAEASRSKRRWKTIHKRRRAHTKHSPKADG